MTEMSTIIQAELTQYTPLLHFQGQQDGACLRASEVKPALDRFIRAWLEKQGVNIVKDAWIYTSDDNDNKNKRHIAFRYRMTFRAKGDMPNGYTCNKGRYSLRDGKPNVKPDRENTHIHPLFFAAMGVDGFDVRPDTRVGEEVESRIKGVFYNDGMSMTILVPGAETVCIDDKNKSLADVMKELLPPFFALHCFGNRSNKGFGSFGVKSINGTDVEPLTPNALKSYAPLGTVYYAAYSQNQFSNDNPINRHKKYLDDVFMLSSLIKGGLNYTHGNPNDKRYYKGMIIQYFLEKDIKSEKAAIKSFVLNRGNKEEDDFVRDHFHESFPTTIDECRFVRGIIGLPQQYEYKQDGSFRDGTFVLRNPHSKRKGTVLVQNKVDRCEHNRIIESTNSTPDIIRFENPIHFKPYGQYLLLIPQIIPKTMLENKFYLIKKTNHLQKNPRTGRIIVDDRTVYTAIQIPSDFNLIVFLDYCKKKYSDDYSSNKANFNERGPAQTIYNALERITSIQKSGGDDNG